MSIDKFQAFADRVIRTITKMKESPKEKTGNNSNVKRVIRELDTLVNTAYDATALHMLEGRVTNGDRILLGLERKFKAITEKWFVMPQLGVGNDLNPASGGGDGAYNGVPALPGMVKAAGDSGGAKAESVKKYVDEFLTEDNEKKYMEQLLVEEESSCTYCGHNKESHGASGDEACSECGKSSGCGGFDTYPYGPEDRCDCNNCKKAKTEADDNWMQDVNPKKGALHKQMGIPDDEKIPTDKLQAAAGSDDSSPLLKKRANLALRYRGEAESDSSSSSSCKCGEPGCDCSECDECLAVV